ncbi:MAG: hypothetical protein WA990_07960 [Rubrobacteraceae bacterium]
MKVERPDGLPELQPGRAGRQDRIEGSHLEGLLSEGEDTPRRPKSFWLLHKRENRIRALVLRRPDGAKVLAVFSSKEGAHAFIKEFLGHEASDENWEARETETDEPASLLDGPRSGVEEVALDPSPKIESEATVGFVGVG